MDEFIKTALAEEIARLPTKVEPNPFDGFEMIEKQFPPKEYPLYNHQQQAIAEVGERYSKSKIIALGGIPFFTILLTKAEPQHFVGTPSVIDLPEGATGFDGESSDGLGVGTRQS